MSIPLREGELLPCPFCGSPARLDRKVGRVGTACPSGWLREKVVCRNRKCEVAGPVFKRPGLAIAAWNTRSTPPSRPQGEEGWLIEEWDSRRDEFKARWWALEVVAAEPSWTTNSLVALRFGRERDAQAYIAEAGWTEAKPTEHAWAALSNPHQGTGS